jgi:hypothetical protein
VGIRYRSSDGSLFALGDRVWTKLLALACLVSAVVCGPNLGRAQDLSALEAAVKSRACPGNPASVRRIDAMAQCDAGGKASAACDQQNKAPGAKWQQCHLEILKCRGAVAQKNTLIEDYNRLVEECRNRTDEAKSSEPKSMKPAAKPPIGPQPQKAERPRKGREAAEQAEAARQNAEALEQQRAEQNARETAGRICIADEGGYLIDTWTKKSPASGVCQDLCNHTPATGLPPPADDAQNLGKRERYCERQCQVTGTSGGRCYQIKPDQRATVLQALRQDWEVHEESQFLPGH